MWRSVVRQCLFVEWPKQLLQVGQVQLTHCQLFRNIHIIFVLPQQNKSLLGGEMCTKTKYLQVKVSYIKAVNVLLSLDHGILLFAVPQLNNVKSCVNRFL